MTLALVVAHVPVVPSSIVASVAVCVVLFKLLVFWIWLCV